MDKLTEIMAWKRREIAPRLRPVKETELERLGALPRRGPSFCEALVKPAHLTVIAEIKRRSPSAGAISKDAAAAEQARKYYNAGADALSVLTDEEYFGGTIRDLWDVCELMQNRDDARPVLRKDFFFHPLQVAEAAEAGAAAILIIVRALNDDEIKALDDAAALAGLDRLYEVHEESELERALKFDPSLVGVNNRDLTRFVIDLSISEKLIPQFPKNVTAVSESGIQTAEDAARVRQAGAKAILVGEILMKRKDPEPLIKELRGLPSP